MYTQLVENMAIARKDRNSDSVTLHSTIIGELQRVSDGKPETLTNEQIIKKIRSLVASVEEVVNNGGTDKEWELEILNSYLPQMMTEEQTITAVKEAIASSGAKTPKEMGKVMGALKVHASVMDMKIASSIVKQELSGS